MFTSHSAWNARRARTQDGSRPRRLAEGFGFIAVWMGLGYRFRGGDEICLLMGIR